ncbi:MAG: Transcriptional regulator, YafY family [Ktedonobacterales bacterium]|jgi:predicted DNA-binding transcriptional regulator YafY|nr:MAG: Transcriptional regulator, YafY family [Ktedonobacterales bacterium]
MKELDRILGILLILQSQRMSSAKHLAKRFGVSTRTIYRDIQTMSLLGIPLYTERGRTGGIRLLEGYFLPPLMFTREEAIALLLGLLVLRSLRAAPFPEEIDTATHKLLAAVPEHLRLMLARLDTIIGVERHHPDIFHPEPDEPTPPRSQRNESAIITRFLQAVLDHKTLRMQYQSPYRATATTTLARPLGLFWDRDRWYFVSDHPDHPATSQTWRADRVSDLTATSQAQPEEAAGDTSFDVGALLGHAWLKSAMDLWRERAPVRLRITAEQAHQLQQDWYYRFAHYEAGSDTSIIMTFGEGDPHAVLPLLRWLGPGATLLSPEPWRPILRAQLEDMLRAL